MRPGLLLLVLMLPAVSGAQELWFSAPPGSSQNQIALPPVALSGLPGSRFRSLPVGPWHSQTGRLVSLPTSVAGASAVTLSAQVQLSAQPPLWLAVPAAGPYAALYWDGRLLGTLGPDHASKLIQLPPDACRPGPHTLRVELQHEPYVSGYHSQTVASVATPQMLYLLPPLLLVPDTAGYVTLVQSSSTTQATTDSAWVYPAWHPTYGIWVAPDVFRHDLLQLHGAGIKTLHLPHPLVAYLGAEARSMGFSLIDKPPATAAYVHSWPGGGPAWLNGAGRPTPDWGTWRAAGLQPASSGPQGMPDLMGLLGLLFVPWLAVIIWKLADNEHWGGVFSWARRARSYEQIGRAQLLTGISFPMGLISLWLFQSCLTGMIWVLAWLWPGAELVHPGFLGGLIPMRGLPAVSVALGASVVLLGLALFRIILFNGLCSVYGYRQTSAKQLQIEVFASLPMLVVLHGLAGVLGLALLRGNPPVWVLQAVLAMFLGALALFLIWRYSLLANGLRQHMRLPPVAVALYICGLEWLPLIWFWFGLALG